MSLPFLGRVLPAEQLAGKCWALCSKGTSFCEAATLLEWLGHIRIIAPHSPVRCTGFSWGNSKELHSVGTAIYLCW